MLALDIMKMTVARVSIVTIINVNFLRTELIVRLASRVMEMVIVTLMTAGRVIAAQA